MDDRQDYQQELECSRDHPLAVEEWLASCVLEHIADPRAVCRLALVNKNFCAASVSDTVWQKLLPPPNILNPFLAHANHQPLSKKHLFIDLCKSITYDQGLKKFWLDPATGGECHMMSARALCVIWGDTPQYWQWKPYSGSMFSEVACLRAVCWFEVKGTFQNVFRPGRYMVSFRLQLHSTHDWESTPVTLCVQNATCAHPPQESQVHFDIPSFKIRPCPSSNMFATSSKQAMSDSEGLLEPSGGTSSERGHGMQHTNGVEHQERQRGQHLPFFRFWRPLLSIRQAESFSKASDDEGTNGTSEVKESEHPSLVSNSKHIWVECDVGEFIVDDDNENRPIEVMFSMREIETNWWKGGLFLDGVIIRPSYVIDNFDNEENKTSSP